MPRRLVHNFSNSDNTVNWTPFRAAEKKFKSRAAPPDLSQVLDLTRPDQTLLECRNITQHGARKEVLIVPSIPGLVLLPSFVDQEEQRQLVQWALRDHACPPNETNLDVHYHLPPEGLWKRHLSVLSNPARDVLIEPKASSDSTVDPDIKAGPRKLIDNLPVSEDNFSIISSIPKPPAPPSSTLKATTAVDLVPKLRWANIGWYYHWGSKQYDFTKGKGVIDEQVRRLCKSSVMSVDWGIVYSKTCPDFLEWETWNDTYEPDAGIVNFYQSKDTLMAHVDRSEVCATSPLISISLGNSAIFLIGGSSRDSEPLPILLRSGDVIIMSGPICRRAYHGVPRILENTLPCHLKSSEQLNEWDPYADYLNNSRINVNVRQVFPKGFGPWSQ